MNLGINNKFTLSRVQGNKDIKIADIFTKINIKQVNTEIFSPSEYLSPEQVSYAKYKDSNRSFELLQKSKIVNPKTDLPKTNYYITKELNSIYYILSTIPVQSGDIIVKKIGSFFDPTNNFFIVSEKQTLVGGSTIAICKKYKGKLGLNDDVIVIRNGNIIYDNVAVSHNGTKNKFPLNFVSDDGGKIQRYDSNLINSFFEHTKGIQYNFADTFSGTESTTSTKLSTFNLSRV